MFEIFWSGGHTVKEFAFEGGKEIFDFVVRRDKGAQTDWQETEASFVIKTG